MVLMMARWEAGPREQRPNSRAIFSWLRFVVEAKDTQMRVGKKTLGRQKPYWKWAEWQPKVESTYSFSWCWWRGSCCWWRWWWARTIPADHRSMRQQFLVLQDSCSELSISRPAMTTKDGRGWLMLTLHQSRDRGKGGIRRSAWTHN
jgi:hypothetical protein